MELLDKFLQDKYQKKRAIIIAIFGMIFLVFSLTIYFITRPTATCTDGIQNQNEEGIDCGGVCGKCEKNTAENLVIEEKGFIESGIVGKYDLYAKVKNPNNIYGSNKFRYEFVLKNSTGEVIVTKKGSAYILPGESKYVVGNSIASPNVAPASVDFVLSDQSWVEFKDYFEKPQLKVVNKQYSLISSGVGFSEVTGLLKNESPYDFNLIELEIILRDINGKIVALNSTEMRTVRTGENRDFRSLWMNRFHGDVMNVEVQTEVDVFNSESFIKKSINHQSSDYR